MNVLNVADIERALTRYAARCFSEHGKRWVQTVPRNYLLGSPNDKDTLANFRHVIRRATKDMAYRYIPTAQLPEWANKALDEGKEVVWFDTVQITRRDFWRVLEIIILWINSWKPTDTRLPRINRISFPVATQAAALWFKDVSENIWHYVTDKPVTVKVYEHGFRWVKLVSALQFEREGKLQGHCIGNGSYFNRWRQTGQCEYYSLRDKENKPHVTVEISVESSHSGTRKCSVLQCKGHADTKPAKIYQPYIRRFFDDMGWAIAGDQNFID